VVPWKKGKGERKGTSHPEKRQLKGVQATQQKKNNGEGREKILWAQQLGTGMQKIPEQRGETSKCMVKASKMVTKVLVWGPQLGLNKRGEKNGALRHPDTHGGNLWSICAQKKLR